MNESRVLETIKRQTLAQSVSGIARAAGLPRTTTDYILRKLVRKRLAIKIIRGKRYRWRYRPNLGRALLRMPVYRATEK